MNSPSPGETAARSLLEKPLYLLTEDDISQLTREDCRRYLKEKGMRRPSWNKSQAIQQVISLKTLFESPADAEAAEARKKLCIPRPDLPPRAASISVYPEKGKAADARISVPAENSARNWRQDPPERHVSGNNSGRGVAAKGNIVSPRITPTPDEPVGQMTIFYRGKVNVYDDMPRGKAQAILQLAGSPLPVPRENIAVQSTLPQSPPRHIWAAGYKVGTICPMVNFPTRETVKLADYSHLPRVESNSSHDDSLGYCSATFWQFSAITDCLFSEVQPAEKHQCKDILRSVKTDEGLRKRKEWSCLHPLASTYM